MAAFKDTHFLRMAAPTGAEQTPPAAAAPAPLPEPPPYQPADPVDFAAIVPAQIDRAGLVNGAAIPPLHGGVEPAPSAQHPSAPVLSPPPPLPASEAPRQGLSVVVPAGEETGSIEDTTADLLRPMLRQWLADNMPRMVEKALHIEIAESVKTPKKP
jgi:hypothetical protein